MSAFDGNWTISFAASNADLSGDADGVVVGNGKLCLFPSSDAVDTKRVLVTTTSQTSRDTAYANTVDGFSAHRVFFHTASNAPVGLALRSQQLNMYTGIFTSVFDSTDPAFPLSVACDLYACRQFPFSTVQTLRITPTSNIAGVLGLQHETYGSASMGDATFQTSSIFNETASSQGAVYFVEGSAPVSLTGDTVAVSSTFLCDPAFVNLGFNAYRSDPKRCYNRFALSNLTANTTYTFNVLSSQMTSADYKSPGNETRRVCLNMALLAASPVAQIRSDHIASWAATWNGRVSVDPKLGVSDAESAAIVRLNRHLKFAMYNVYSTTRENALATSPLPGATPLGAIDLHGSVSLDGDLWLVPLLILFRPEAARAILEFRYRELASAIQLASSYGLKGAQYPYVNDSVGYTDALYWDVLSPMHVFNTALVAVSAWNYYRTTLDDEWLRSQGYPILKNTADFFASKAQVDDDGSVHLRRVVGLDPGVDGGDDESMTNYLVRLAVKYAIEASYQVGAIVKDAWTELYYGLPVTVFPGTEVVALDAQADASGQARVLETLIPLVPYYSYVFYRVDLRSNRAPASNLAFWEAHTDAGYVANPVNRLMRAMLHAQCARTTTVAAERDAHLGAFATLLDAVLGAATPVWGNLTRAGAGGSYNDVTLSALLLLVVVLGCGGVDIKGGVAESRFYYEMFKIDVLNYGVLPRTWKQVLIGGFGSARRTAQVINALTYP
jgi:protein-glucosylgalactosylhydroxylysine glucosidase